MAENNSSAPLLPCPFCGGEADIQSGARGMWNIAGCMDAACSGFRASGPHNNPSKASGAWNTRAPQAVAAQAAPAAVAVPDEREMVIQNVMKLVANWGITGHSADFEVMFKAWVAIETALRAALAATPALPATDSSAGDLAEVQAEPVASGEYLPLPMQVACNGYFPVYSSDQMRAYADAHRSTAPQAQPADALEPIRQAVRDYHHALDARQHGGVAAHKAIYAIEEALGTHWQQGQETGRRAAMAAAQEGVKA